MEKTFADRKTFSANDMVSSVQRGDRWMKRFLLLAHRSAGIPLPPGTEKEWEAEDKWVDEFLRSHGTAR